MYLQFAAKVVLGGKVSGSKSIGISGAKVSGGFTIDADLLQTTFAATIGQQWNATRRVSGKWRTTGTALGDVAVWGKLGEITISGEACGQALFISKCFGFSLGGLTKLLPFTEVGAYFKASFLPFDVTSGEK